MLSFSTYEELQNLLLYINENSETNHISKFIIQNGMLYSINNSILTMKLIASFAFSRPKLINKIISMLITIPKFNFDLSLISVDDFQGIYTNIEIIQRIKILYLLLLRSNHIKESAYDYVVKKYNDTFLYTTENPFQNINFKRFLYLDNDPLIYKAILNDDIDLLQQLISLNNIDINQYFNFPNFEIYEKFKSSTLLQYSAFFGSIYCFKFLLLNTDNNDFNILLEYSIAGGNADIVHITENEIHDDIENKQQLLYTAILFMQNDLIEYIIEYYDTEIDVGCYIKCILSSNYAALKKLMELDNYESLDKFFQPIDSALYNEQFPFFYFLVTLNDNFTNYNKIFYCINNNELFNLILDTLQSKMFYINYFYNTPFYDIYYYLAKALDHYLNKEDEKLAEYNWINDEISSIGDEKYYMIRKRFYAKKYKKKKYCFNSKKRFKKIKNNISKKIIKLTIHSSLSEYFDDL